MEEYLIWNEFGNIHLGTASYDEAIQAYSKAIELAPNFGWPYRNLASAFISKGRFAEAVPLLQKSIDLLTGSTDKAISFNKLGDAYRNLGNYQAALDAYQQADALSAVENLDWPASTEPEMETDPEHSESDPAARMAEIEPQVEAAAESEPVVAVDETITPDPVAEEAEPQVEAALESEPAVAAEEAPAPEPVDEETAPQVEAALESELPVAAEETDKVEAVAEEAALQVEAVEESEPPVAAEETIESEAANDEVEPQVEAVVESELPVAAEETDKVEAVAEETAPQAEAIVESELPVAAEETVAPETQSEQVDESVAEIIEFSAEVETEDHAVASDLRLAQASSPEPSGEVVSSEGEPQAEEAVAPFVLEGSSPESYEGNQQNDTYNLVALSSTSFDVPAATKSVDKKNGHRYELDVEETELPEWLEEHITTPETEDFSDYVIWQPLTIKEEDVNDRGPGFNFVELPSDSTEGEGLTDPQDDLIADSEIFSNFAPEPLQASTSMDFIDQADPEHAIKTEQVDVEKDVTAESSSSTMSEAVTDNEGGLPEAEEAQVTDPVVTTNELSPAGINDLTHKSEEDLKQSVLIYKKITDINPTNDRAWHTLGELYKSLHQYDEAIAAYEKAISLNAEKDIYHYHLGLVYATKKRNSEASRSFQKVLIINPEHVLAHCALAGSYRRLGLEDEAMEHLTIVEPIIQSETEYNRACFQAISENADEAIRLLKIALEKKQTSLDWALRDPDLDNIRDDPRFSETIMSQEILPES
jgi:tetratricopeptide (TPR) repeat protein